MTKDEAMKLALEALDSASRYGAGGFDDAKDAIREALAEQPAQQEPDNSNDLTIAYMAGVQRGKELAQRTWVGLTEEERIQFVYHICNLDPYSADPLDAAVCAIEELLRKKNT